MVMYPAAQPLKFDAFISYSHSSDPRLAPALRRALQNFAKPWWRRRALRVFQDASNLETNPDLWGTIQKALLGSRALVLLCSPASAASPGVGKEIAAWLAANREPGSSYLLRHRPILLVLTDGEIHWDEARRDFDWTRTTAVPRALSGAFPGEPLWLDLRWARDASQLSLRDPRFRDAVASLAAPLRGRSKDDLIGDDIKQWRRTRRTAWSAAVLLATLTLVAGSSAVYANHQRTVAEQALAQLLQEQRKTVARSMALEALLTRETNPQLSLRLSTAAYALVPDDEAREAARQELVKTLLQTHYVTGSEPGVDETVEYETYLTPKVFGRHGDVLLTQVPKKRPPLSQLPTISPVNGPEPVEFRLWDTTDPRHPVVRSVLSGHEATSRFATSAAFSPDGGLLATADQTTILLWDVRDLAAPRQLATIRPSGTTNGVAFSRDGRRLGAVGRVGDDTPAGWLTLWDVTDPARPHQLATGSEPDHSSTLDFSADGRLVVTARDNILGDEGTGQIIYGTRLALWNVADPGQPTAYPTPIRVTSGAVAWSPIAPILVNAHDLVVDLWDLRDPGQPRLVATLEGHSGTVRGLTFSSDGRHLVTASGDKSALLWDVSDPTKPVRLLDFLGHADAVAAAAFSLDGTMVTTVDDHDTVVRWRLGDGQPQVIATRPQTTQVHAIAVNHTGTLLATSGTDGRVVLWDVRSPQAPQQVGTITGLGAWVRAVAFSADGTILATGNDEGASLATATTGTVRLWDVRDPARPRQLAAVPVRLPVESLAFHPTHPTLSVLAANPAVAFGDGWAGVFDVSEPATPRLVGEHQASDTTSVFSVVHNAFSPDGRLLGLAGRWWDVSQAGRAVALPEIRTSGNLVFSPDGQLVYDIGSTTLRVYDFADPTKPHPLSQLPLPIEDTRTTLLYPGGDLLIVVDTGGNLLFVDVGDPRKPLLAATLRVLGYRTHIGVLSPDGAWIAVASTIGREFSISTLGDVPRIAGNAVPLACQLAGELTDTEWQTHAPEVEPITVCS